MIATVRTGETERTDGTEIKTAAIAVSVAATVTMIDQIVEIAAMTKLEIGIGIGIVEIIPVIVTGIPETEHVIATVILDPIQEIDITTRTVRDILLGMATRPDTRIVIVIVIATVTATAIAMIATGIHHETIRVIAPAAITEITMARATADIIPITAVDLASISSSEIRDIAVTGGLHHHIASIDQAIIHIRLTARGRVAKEFS